MKELNNLEMYINWLLKQKDRPVIYSEKTLKEMLILINELKENLENGNNVL